MKKSILILCLISFISCKKDNQEVNSALNIVIENFKNQKITFSDIVTDIRIMLLNTDENNLLGNIKDICFSSHYIYVLDDLTASVFMFRIEDGSFLKRICTKGNGPNEYISPTAIRHNSMFVYLLDLPTKRIIVYNEELEAIKTIQLSVSASDFVCMDKGFLLYNMDDSPESYKLIYTDSMGSVVDKFIPCTEFNNSGIYNWGRPKNFSKYNQDVFFSEPFSSKIYLWKNKHLLMNYQLDFKEYTISDKLNINNHNIFEDFAYTICTNFYLIKEWLVVSFLYDNNRYYSFTNLLSNDQKVGVIEEHIPFFPQWQNENTLIGYCHYEDIKDFLVTQKSNSVSEDDETPCLIFFTLH
ncbi:hypothetical protein FACS189426_01050 [Bacteroidia bacterium]|nr:hypothetical protein FACS189426_01050 [Bacteroidia bacterium]